MAKSLGVEWSLRLKPRGWQREALSKWQSNLRGIVSVVTGGGKTVFAQLCMNAVAEKSPDTQFILVVPSITLLDQWYVSLVEDLNVSPDEIACYSGQEKPKKPNRVNILVINTARDWVEKLAILHPSFLIVDECHRAGSPTNAKALKGEFIATLGLSATPIREYDDGYTTYLEPSLGEIVYSYDYRQAYEDKVICPFNLVNVKVPLLEKERVEYNKMTRKLVSLLKKSNGTNQEDDERIKRVLQRRASISSSATMRIPVAAKIIDNSSSNRSILFHESVEDATKLFEILKERGHRVTIYHSKIPPSIRRSNLQMYRQGLFDVLVCCRALDEGMNVPETEVAVIASSTASTRQRIQRLGRVLRPSKGKESAIIYTLFATSPEERRLVDEESELQGVSNVSWMKAGT
jgi:superfamily II DNA or RNA helicase